MTILAVNLTTSEKSSNNIGAFVKDYGLTFPVVLDTKGVIREKIVGPMDKEMMTELLQSVD